MSQESEMALILIMGMIISLCLVVINPNLVVTFVCIAVVAVVGLFYA